MKEFDKNSHKKMTKKERRELSTEYYDWKKDPLGLKKD